MTALNHNHASLASLTAIMQQESLGDRVDIHQVDLNDYAIQGEYDIMMSTVVMMFLLPSTPARLIQQMQAHTAPGGCNLIVAAMSTEDYRAQCFSPLLSVPEHYAATISTLAGR